MTTARKGSALLALILLLAPSAALAKKHKGRDWDDRRPGWDQRRDHDDDDDDDRDDRRVYRGRDRGVYRNGGLYGQYRNVAFNNGYNDGYQKGRDDGEDSRAFDPTRLKWYRSANRGYNDRYGSKAEYQNVYRDGFRSGYDAGYRDGDRRYGSPRGTSRFPWPF